MLLAIDVGNSHTVFGLHDGDRWVDTWRHRTNIESTEDELAAWLKSMFDLAKHPFEVQSAVCASVVPGIDRTLKLLTRSYFNVDLKFLTGAAAHGVQVDYEPKSSVGADRIANALGALAIQNGPIVVVDFGTATTFDVIDAANTYIGGAILAGPLTSLSALVKNTAKLPAIDLRAPEKAIGKNTSHSIASGVMFGYAGAINELIRKITEELGQRPVVISTGGLGEIFTELCEGIDSYNPMLTLEGLRLFAKKS